MLKKSNQSQATGFSLQDIYVTIWEEIHTSKCHHSYLILTLNLLTTTIVAPPSNASKWQMVFNSAFKGLKLL